MCLRVRVIWRPDEDAMIGGGSEGGSSSCVAASFGSEVEGEDFGGVGLAPLQRQ